MNFLLGERSGAADIIHDQFIDVFVSYGLRFCVGPEPNLHWIMNQDMIWFVNEFN